MGLKKKIKDRLYYELVLKNPNIKNEYQAYIDSNKDYHQNHRWQSWKFLRKLNKYYCNISINQLEENFDDNLLKPLPPIQLSDQIDLPNTNIATLDSSIMSKPELFSREPAHLILELLKYDIVSFDIFDTLILRPFAKSSDLFMLLAGYYKNVDFHKLRIKAEADMRQINQLYKGNREITIYDIYEHMKSYSDIDVRSGVDLEFYMELELCYANPYMQTLFSMLKAAGRRIIAISNMYYPHDMMIQLLEKCGYAEFEEIFISCDYQANKESGHLYAIVEKKVVKGASVIHIGDNDKLDICAPLEHGWDAHLYSNINTFGNSSIADEMSPLIGSAYQGIIKGHLFNGLNQYTPAYEFGFLYGGIFAVGFCHWIHRYCKDNQIEKILFLAEDGDTLKKIYDMLYSDIASEYIFFSRKVSLRIAINTQRYYFFESEILRVVQSGEEMLSVEQCLDLLKVNFLAPMLERYDLDAAQLLGNENKATCDRFLDMLMDNFDKIIESTENENEAARQYISSFITKNTKIAIVDIGWRGSSCISLKTLIEDQWNMNCKVFGLVAAICKSESECCVNQLMDRTISSYLFSPMYNRCIYEKSKQNIPINVAFLDLIFRAKHPPLEGFYLDDEGRFRLDFGVPDVENYLTIEEISRGINGFAMLYNKLFASFPLMKSIPGADVCSSLFKMMEDHRKLPLCFKKQTF